MYQKPFAFALRCGLVKLTTVAYSALIVCFWDFRSAIFAAYVEISVGAFALRCHLTNLTTALHRFTLLVGLLHNQLVCSVGRRVACVLRYCLAKLTKASLVPGAVSFRLPSGHFQLHQVGFIMLLMLFLLTRIYSCNALSRYLSLRLHLFY